MMPDNVLSTVPVPSAFLPPRNQPWQALIDYDNGPIGISDPSRGLFARQWRGRYVDGFVVYDAPGVAPFQVAAVEDLAELSITFDQNGRPCFAYKAKSGACKMYWFNTLDNAYEFFDLGSTTITPRVVLDDKRPNTYAQANSDILLAYVRGSTLYFRQQRDRFTIERTLSSTWSTKGLARIGMGLNFRMQYEERT